MTLRESFRPLRPDLEGFLFAQVGDEVDGMPLSMISALTRLGLDPWEEAARLCSFSEREAVEQLARLIGDLPGHAHRLRDARQIAVVLVALLPRRPRPAPAPPLRARRKFGLRLGHWPAGMPHGMPQPSQFWVACLVVAGAALVSAIIHHGFPFGIGSL